MQLKVRLGPHYYQVILCSCAVLCLLRLLGDRWLGLRLHVAVLSPENQPVEILPSLYDFIQSSSLCSPRMASSYD